jgi:low affinity Fe/Cu permease
MAANKKNEKKKKNLFEKFANWATIATGSSTAFIVAVCVIILWLITVAANYQYRHNYHYLFNGFPDTEISKQRLKSSTFKTERIAGLASGRQ